MTLLKAVKVIEIPPSPSNLLRIAIERPSSKLTNHGSKARRWSKLLPRFANQGLKIARMVEAPSPTFESWFKKLLWWLKLPLQPENLGLKTARVVKVPPSTYESLQTFLCLNSFVNLCFSFGICCRKWFQSYVWLPCHPCLRMRLWKNRAALAPECLQPPTAARLRWLQCHQRYHLPNEPPTISDLGKSSAKEASQR